MQHITFEVLKHHSVSIDEVTVAVILQYNPGLQYNVCVRGLWPKQVGCSPVYGFTEVANSMELQEWITAEGQGGCKGLAGCTRDYTCLHLNHMPKVRTSAV